MSRGVDAAVSTKPALTTAAVSALAADAPLGEVSCEIGERPRRRVTWALERRFGPSGRLKKPPPARFPSNSADAANRACRNHLDPADGRRALPPLPPSPA